MVEKLCWTLGLDCSAISLEEVSSGAVGVLLQGRVWLPWRTPRMKKNQY